MKTQSFNSKIVDEMLKRIRELELEKIDYLEQRFRETKKQLILKEKKAKKSLVEVDQQNPKLKKNTELKRILECYQQTIELNPWEADQNPLEDRWKLQSLTPLPTLSCKKKHHKRLSFGQQKENQNSIPKFKHRLQKLQSPSKKTQNNSNFMLDLNDLCKKRKCAIKVIDILKIQQNNINTILRPQSQLGNFQTKQHLTPIHFNKKQSKKSFGAKFNELKDNQLMVKMIKQKRQQQNNQMKIISQTITPKRNDSMENKNLKKEKGKEKLTLLKLLS